ncbi:MAG: deoxyribonuclease IV [Spiroplasma sp.]|nr:deoxyribonuclease IV [Spiroplasma sp.]
MVAIDNNKLIIGCHVAMKAPKYLLGSIQEAFSYNANALMIYTGAPQNAVRKPISQLLLKEFHEELTKTKININNVIVHAPYIINLANTIKASTFNFSVELLQKELKRCQEIGVNTLVLHPGSAVGAEKNLALKQIIKGLDQACFPNQTVKIALETMAGKGSETCSTFQDLAYIINNVKNKSLLGVCWDTCHLYDAGYDIVNNLEQVIKEFDQLIGLKKLFVLHINDSKFGLNSHKDRHENLGFGKIGFNPLLKIIYHPLFTQKTKILETPWINKKPPYKEEIIMIHNKSFDKESLLKLKG